MNAPLRSVEDLITALRGAQIERELSDDRFEAIAGLPERSIAKYLGPKRSKGLGSISLPLILGGLGKALVLVDDPEAIEKVKSRWIKRKIVGGSAIQLKMLSAASLGTLNQQQMPLNSDQQEVLGRMQILGRKGGIKSGKTRKAKAERRKTLQRIRSHAARIRWAKHRKS